MEGKQRSRNGIRMPRNVALVLLGVALTLGLGLVSTGQWGAQLAGASDPAFPEFVMEVKGVSGCTTDATTAPTAKDDVICDLQLGDPFTVSVLVTSTGTVLGDTTNAFQAVIDWTSGLTGPGEAEGKTNAILNCPGLALVAPNPWQGRPHTSAVACSAFTLTNAQVKGIRGEFQMTCSSTPSQELVKMVVGTGPGDPTDPNFDWLTAPQNNTNLTDLKLSPVTDKDGTEVLTIHCGGPITPVPPTSVTPTTTDTPVPPTATPVPSTATSTGGPSPTPTATDNPPPTPTATPATFFVDSSPQAMRGVFGSIAVPAGPFNANVVFSRQLANDSYTLIVTEIGGARCNVLAKSASGFSVSCFALVDGSLDWAVLVPRRR